MESMRIFRSKDIGFPISHSPHYQSNLPGYTDLTLTGSQTRMNMSIPHPNLDKLLELYGLKITLRKLQFDVDEQALGPISETSKLKSEADRLQEKLEHLEAHQGDLIFEDYELFRRSYMDSWRKIELEADTVWKA